MDADHSNEVSMKIRAAIKAKLEELGAYVDEELPDYIMVMIANKKKKEQMTSDLNLFLGKNSTVFVTWLVSVIERLQTLGSSKEAGPKEKKKDKKEKKKREKDEEKEKEKKEKEKPRKKETEKSKSKRKQESESPEKVERAKPTKTREKGTSPERKQRVKKSPTPEKRREKEKPPPPLQRKRIEPPKETRDTHYSRERVRKSISPPEEEQHRSPSPSPPKLERKRRPSPVPKQELPLRKRSVKIYPESEEEAEKEKPGPEKKKKRKEDQENDEDDGIEKPVVSIEEPKTTISSVVKPPDRKVPPPSMQPRSTLFMRAMSAASKNTIDDVRRSVKEKKTQKPKQEEETVEEKEQKENETSKSRKRSVPEEKEMKVKFPGDPKKLRIERTFNDDNDDDGQEVKRSRKIEVKSKTERNIVDEYDPEEPEMPVFRRQVKEKSANDSDDEEEWVEYKPTPAVEKPVPPVVEEKSKSPAEIRTQFVVTMDGISDAFRNRVEAKQRSGDLESEVKSGKKGAAPSSPQIESDDNEEEDYDNVAGLRPTAPVNVDVSIADSTSNLGEEHEEEKQQHTVYVNPSMAGEIQIIEQEKKESSSIPVIVTSRHQQPQLSIRQNQPQQFSSFHPQQLIKTVENRLAREEALQPIGDSSSRSSSEAMPGRVPEVSIRLDEDDEEDDDLGSQSALVSGAYPAKLPGGLPGDGRPRCRFWPRCKQEDNCPFAHPSIPCSRFPKCSFGNKCLFIHPPCKFDVNCTKSDCPFTHYGHGAQEDDEEETKASTEFAVPKGPAGALPGKRKEFDGEKPTSGAPPCKFRANCQNPSCTFAHPKMCKFGEGCHNVDCQFGHRTRLVPPSRQGRGGAGAGSGLSRGGRGGGARGGYSMGSQPSKFKWVAKKEEPLGPTEGPATQQQEVKVEGN